MLGKGTPQVQEHRLKLPSACLRTCNIHRDCTMTAQIMMRLEATLLNLGCQLHKGVLDRLILHHTGGETLSDV